LKGGIQLSADKVADIQSTSDWAYYGRNKSRHFPDIWANVTAEEIEQHGGSQLGTYYNPKENYDSPAIHTVVLAGLDDGASYNFRVDNDDTVYTFTMPRQGYPFVVGLLSDVGQTPVSNSSFNMMKSLTPDVVLLSGDLSYADGYYDLWDSFGRLLEPLGARYPIMTCVGNHETASGEAFQSYLARYPMPHAASHSSNPTIWSRDIGPMHVIALNSYAGSSKGSNQYNWLKNDLRQYSRERTPWLVVMMHVPFYNSNARHSGEAKLMMENLEEMFFEYGVNMVLNGHVHSFERTWATYKNKTNPCGPTYFNLGDAGNREGLTKDWLPGEEGEAQPSWSAFRQGSFGVGKLHIVNGTHSQFTWTRNACFDPETSRGDFDRLNCKTTGIDATVDPFDSVWIERASYCKNQEA